MHFGLKKRLPLILTVTMTIYFLVVMLTPFSLTGFWTDNLFALGLVIFSINRLYKGKIENKITKTVFRFTTLISAVVVFGIIGLHAINPFSWNTVKTKMVERTTNGNLIEMGYFKPTGAWGCGYGSYWKTQTLKYFPIIEYMTYKNDCTHDDWGYYIRTGKWE